MPFVAYIAAAEEPFNGLITRLDGSGIKATIKDYGIDEDTFLSTLDEMVEQAFDDQCTGANPRYPLMSEIKQMYLNAYYGKHFTEPKMPDADFGAMQPDAIKTPYRKGKKA
jgi:acetaldehyde dehydrogenase/alcohol dehydrogenase